MDLNSNIKSIIYQYYTCTEAQLDSFKESWKEEIKSVNKLFNIKFADYIKECFVCPIKLHRNCECNKFYNEVHIINLLTLK